MRNTCHESKNLSTNFVLKNNFFAITWIAGHTVLAGPPHKLFTYSASELSDVSYTGEIVLESSAYLVNIGFSNRSNSKSLRKMLN